MIDEELLAMRISKLITIVILIDLLQGYDTSAQLSAIDDLVAQHAPIQTVLRLLILANLTTGGIKAKALENLKREILQVGSTMTCRTIR